MAVVIIPLPYLTFKIILMLKYIFLFTLLFALPGFAAAQTPTQQAQLQSYLADRDVTQSELLVRLQAEGINVANMSDAQLVASRPRIEAIIAEIEAEKVREAQATRENAAEAAEDIEEAVEDGASVQEAIGEVTTELANEDDPKSRIYGHQIFRNKSLELYRATDEASPPNSYPLKPGDEIAITIFGQSQADLLLRINDQGFVTLPNQIRIPLAGVSLGDARQLLSDRLKRYYAYRDGELSIRVQVARTISINIFGEVESSGNFTISALNTGFNAIVAAGGPTRNGSVRNIQLVRGDETTVLDVYEYLRNPVQRSDLFLTDNATIYVPLAEKVVQLQGGVLRPMFYELREEETLNDLLAFAGNPLPAAETSVIRITRYQKGVVQVLNVDFAAEPDFALVNGDVVSIPVIENPVEDYVIIEGAVLLPGRYAFEEGIGVANVVSKARLRPGARTDVAFLYRSNDDGTSRLLRVNLAEQMGAAAGAEQVLLKRGDRLQVLSQRAFNDGSSFVIRGAVRDSTNRYPFPEDGALSLEEAVLLAGGARRNATAEVMLIRTPLDNGERRSYLRLNMTEDADFELQPLDEVVVYTNERFTENGARVSISGAVIQGGSYVYDPSLTVRDLLFLAGGTRISAARNRVEIFRLNFSNGAETKTLMAVLDLDGPEATTFTLQPYDQVVVRNTAEFEPIQNVVLRGEIRYPGNYALLKNNEKLSDLVQRAGGLTEEAFAGGATMYRSENDRGNVILDLEAAVNDPDSPSNMVMRRGDTIYIPKQQDLVTIFLTNTIASEFAVDSLVKGRRIQVAYQGPKPANWYIKRYAGGFDDETARRRWTTVQYANGQIRETASFAGVHDYPNVRPGASIRVPAKPEKVQKQRREERFNWVGLAGVIMGGVSTIVSFILISRRTGT